MAIKVLGDIVIDDDGSLKNVTSITYADASVQTTAQTGVPPNIVTAHAAGALVHTLDNPNAFSTSSGDYFGVSVAVSGNYAIVGATNEDDSGGSNSGKAYIFNMTTGALVHILDNPNAYGVSAGDNFGHSVAISGNYAIVGAPYEGDSGGPGSGKAYIFNVLTGVLMYTLDNPNSYSTGFFDFFSSSVAISGNYAIAGAYSEDEAGGAGSGKAYIFNVTTGALVHTLNNPNAYSTVTGDGFGSRVAISGNIAIVSTPYEQDAGGTGSGKAYIFNVTTGALVHTLDNPNAYSTSENDNFGYSVAISGNYAIVGAYNEDDAGGTASGKAYIFNVATGTLMHTLDNPNAFSTSFADNFGQSVAMSGNYAIVGSVYEDDSGGSNSGKAYIFNMTTGALVHTLDNPNAYSTSESDVFGYSVAISGNIAIVGAYNEDDAGGVSSSKAYTFSVEDSKQISNIASLKFANGTDIAPTLNRLTRISAVQGELMHVLDNPNTYSTSSNDQFGISVAVSGNYAIVGASGEDAISGSEETGKAYIYNVTTGALIHVLNNPNAYGGSIEDGFGGSVAISGNYAIVGASGEDDVGGLSSGKAYIFNVTTGALVHTLDNPTAFSTSAGDLFGASVAISGNYAIVGAYLEDDGDPVSGGSGSGKAYIFNVTTGALVRTLSNPNGYNTSAGDNFGRSVAISGNYAVIGLRSEDDAGGADSGKAYIYDVTTGNLLWTLNNPNSTIGPGDQFGTSVAVSGNYAIVGADYEDDSGGDSSGKAYIFNVTTGALVHTLNNPNAYSTSASDYFGRYVTISGNYAIVAAIGESDVGGFSSGKAYIFDVTTGVLTSTINNPNAFSTSTGDSFGSAVSISGNYVIISASGEDDIFGAPSGKAYIFAVDNLTTLDRLYTLVSEA